MPKPFSTTLTLDKIVGGGQALGTCEDGRKAFVWGALPGETAQISSTKIKSKLVEAVATYILTPSSERVTPREPESYLSTSPWQIMSLEAEQRYKAALIEEAFELHNIVLPNPIEIYTDNQQYSYRNKVEFSWWGYTNEKGEEQLDLAFFRRGSKGKIPVNTMSLARPEIVSLALSIRDLLQSKDSITARNLKTLLVRCDQKGNTTWQLYIKDALENIITSEEAASFNAQGGEIIFSDPKSPASRITKRLAVFGDMVLNDTIFGIPFRYACEGFFQVNIPVYEQALKDMRKFVGTKKTVDMYSGVGTIGLTIGGSECTLIEIDENAVREMKRNILQLKSSAQAILSSSENAIEYIAADATIIVDPPRAGLHQDVVTKLLEKKPPRIIYLSCNPATQARDIALLAKEYDILYHRGYNFFPRTPHIEHLVVLERRV